MTLLLLPKLCVVQKFQLQLPAPYPTPSPAPSPAHPHTQRLDLNFAWPAHSLGPLSWHWPVLQMRLLLNQKFKWQRRTRWRHTESKSEIPVPEIINFCVSASLKCPLSLSLPLPSGCSSTRFIMFCNLCPFIVWFSTAFRLVVDQLNMAAAAASLQHLCRALAINKFAYDWPNGQLDERDNWTRAKVNLRPAAGFQKCISYHWRVLVSYAESRLRPCTIIICTCGRPYRPLVCLVFPPRTWIPPCEGPS